ncbi:DUF4394 domain-containing protein [Ideonella sp. DXS22W]|uniref:DUF4394 domain-containing protein n=1 Tax=Pseudaquabacterium inlustre TaxID=2984192 RepID=A0ABU9CDQ5_9BURK
MPESSTRRHLLSVLTAASAAALAACAGVPGAPREAPEPPPVPRKETVLAVTDAGELIRFNAGTPQRIDSRVPLRGLPAGQTLVGMDFRVARGVLYGLTSGGVLVTIDTASGQLKPVGTAAVALQGQRFGVDFNPAADRVRVVSDSGQNLRLHPDTGALAATDPPLAWAPGDVGAAQPPRVAAAGYTYNLRDDKRTTNYALDLATGALLTQGSHEDAVPPVSPNTGLLRTVGMLGTGALDDAAMDISDTDNTALAALRRHGRTRLYRLDLATGHAALLGTVGDGRALWGMAIQP